MRASILAVACAICFVGCSDPRSTALPDDIAKLETIKPQMDKLKPEEKELLVKYVIRRGLQGTILGSSAGATDAKTIGEAIDNQRAFAAAGAKQEAEALVLKQRMQAEREASMKSMREAVTVALLSKRVELERGSSGIELDRHLEVTIAYKNNGQKDVAGVKGRLVVTDLFGDPLSTFLISNDDTIKVGGSTVWKGGRSVKYGPNSTKDQKFADLAEDKYKVTWEPETIVFTDGTRLPPKN